MRYGKYAVFESHSEKSCQRFSTKYDSAQPHAATRTRWMLDNSNLETKHIQSTKKILKVY